MNPSTDAPVMSREFLARPAVAVAPELLGAVLKHHTGDGVVALRISEVEAYQGAEDPGSHAFRGRTARNSVMFGPPGMLYVYCHLGLHHCMNVVCGHPEVATGVLIRAGEIIEGADLARSRRRAAGVVRHDRDLARGPARLAVALAVDLRHNGGDVVGGDSGLSLHRPFEEPGPIATGPRVGVSGDGGDGGRYPWRFWLADEPTVSDYRAHVPRNRSRIKRAG